MCTNFLLCFSFMILYSTFLLKKTLLYFADSVQRHPHFRNQEMINHTMRVGSEASFACIVEHLGRYKVSI